MEEPSCTHCGSEDLRYVATYANGDAYVCLACGEETIEDTTEEE